MGMAKVLPEIPALKASYVTGRIIRLPVNITVSVSYRCNSRCKTCNVWLLPNDDFTLEEWDRTFQSLGRAPYWFTFSGEGISEEARDELRTKLAEVVPPTVKGGPVVSGLAVDLWGGVKASDQSQEVFQKLLFPAEWEEAVQSQGVKLAIPLADDVLDLVWPE